MGSISDALTNFALRAALVSLATILVLLGFIVLRRFYRSLYFKRLDTVGFAFRREWDKLLSFRIPSSTWRWNNFKRAVIERIVLDKLATSSESDCSKVQEFIRHSGLVEKRMW